MRLMNAAGSSSSLACAKKGRGNAMPAKRVSRRDVLIGSAALAVGAAETRVMAAAPAAAITPELVAAAKKEGKLAWYTSVDLPVAEKIARAFEAKYPGVACRVERAGAERVFQRI